MYRNIPSLKEYVLVDSTGTTNVEKYTKNEDATWQLSDYSDLYAKVQLNSIEVVLSLEDIYRGVY
jgi:Uma2 family endonuclease